MKRILLCLLTIAAFLHPAGAQRDTASELSQGTISAFQKGLFLFAPLIYEGFGGSEEELRALWKMTPPATHPGRRGDRLSLLLGAHALMEMHRRFGFTGAMTGVAPGNRASEAICRRMGLAPRGLSIVGMADPALLPGGRMTK